MAKTTKEKMAEALLEHQRAMTDNLIAQTEQIRSNIEQQKIQNKFFERQQNAWQPAEAGYEETT